MTKVFFLSAIFFSSTLFAATSASLEQYLIIQEKLSGDSMEGVVQAARAIAKSEKGVLAQKALKVAQTQNIAEARKEFKALSTEIIKTSATQDRGGAKVAYCPMIDGSWLQRGEELRNPYYGASMLTCGEFKK